MSKWGLKRGEKNRRDTVIVHSIREPRFKEWVAILFSGALGAANKIEHYVCKSGQLH